MKKPGTSREKRESTEEFGQRVGKELRVEADRIMSEAHKRAKDIRKAASKLDGQRS